MKNSDVLREAVAKGYSVDNDGNVWFNNKARKLILNSTGYFEIVIRCKGEKTQNQYLYIVYKLIKNLVRKFLNHVLLLGI